MLRHEIRVIIRDHDLAYGGFRGLLDWAADCGTGGLRLLYVMGVLYFLGAATINERLGWMALLACSIQP